MYGFIMGGGSVQGLNVAQSARCFCLTDIYIYIYIYIYIEGHASRRAQFACVLLKTPGAAAQTQPR